MARRLGVEAERTLPRPPPDAIPVEDQLVAERHDTLTAMRARVRRILTKLPLVSNAARWAWALWNARTTRLVAHAAAERLGRLESALRSDLAHHAAKVANVERILVQAEGRLEDVQHLRGGLDEVARELGAVAALRREVARLRAEVRLLLAKAESAPSPDRNDISAASPPAISPRWDTAFLAMTEETRGSFAEIKDRLRVHLAAVRRAEAGSPQRPILDLGCGRGEWLELLGEEGLCAEGVDLSAAAVEACRERGLIARCGDAIEALRRCADASLGAITAFHLIEHLDLAQHAALLDEALRALAPGGLLLLETPNGESFSVSGRSFWFDPTHRVLHTPASLRRWVDAAGFSEISILRLHPYPESEWFPPSPVSERLNAWFFGPQDFAILAHRPGPAGAPPH